MNLKTRILEDIKTAMREKDKEKLAALRLISAEIKQIEVDKRIELDDQDVIAVLTKMVKQRKESIDQFQKANRTDLVQQEESELSVIMPYLPEQLSDEDVKATIEVAIKESGAESIKDMGKVMAIIKPKLEGRADLSKASQLIKSLLG